MFPYFPREIADDVMWYFLVGILGMAIIYNTFRLLIWVGRMLYKLMESRL